MHIQVFNVRSHHRVNCPFIILNGAVYGNINNNVISLANLSNASEGNEIVSWPVINGQFKAIASLHLGRNDIMLSCCECHFRSTIYYDLPCINRVVVPVYIVCADDDGYFQGPASIDLSPASACRRISLATRLLQTATSTLLSEHGFELKSFVLESDLYPEQPSCHIFRLVAILFY